MEKFKQLFPQGLLLSFIIKMLLVSSTFSDMGIVFGLAGVVALQYYLEKSQEIQDIKTVVSKQNDVIQTMAVEFSKVKTSLEGLRLKNEFKNGSDAIRKVI